MKKTLLVLAALGTLALSACSSDDPDASPGGGNPQTTDSNDTPNLSGDFCNIISQSEVMGDDLNTASDELNALLEDQANWDSPETVAALHTQGEAMLEYADDIVAIYEQAAREAGDAEVSEAFSSLAQYFQLFFTGMGQAAVEADSVMEYMMGMGEYLNQEEMEALTAELTEAGPLISEYIYDTCGYSGFDY